VKKLASNIYARTFLALAAGGAGLATAGLMAIDGTIRALEPAITCTAGASKSARATDADPHSLVSAAHVNGPTIPSGGVK